MVSFYPGRLALHDASDAITRQIASLTKEAEFAMLRQITILVPFGFLAIALSGCGAPGIDIDLVPGNEYSRCMGSCSFQNDTCLYSCNNNSDPSYPSSCWGRCSGERNGCEGSCRRFVRNDRSGAAP
jgi:hypothetical protein